MSPGERAVNLQEGGVPWEQGWGRRGEWGWGKGDFKEWAGHE